MRTLRPNKSLDTENAAFGWHFLLPVFGLVEKKCIEFVSVAGHVGRIRKISFF